MKKSIAATILLVFFCGSTIFSMALPKLPSDSGRKRLYIMAGAGYAFSRIEGLCGGLGVELRLFGQVHARLSFDYYTAGRNKVKNSIRIENGFGLNLYALYKARLTDTFNFNFMLGGHYTGLNERIHALGLSFSSSESAFGIAGGMGFEWQIGNRWDIFIQATAKYIMVSDPWIWIQTQMGFRFRIK